MKLERLCAHFAKKKNIKISPCTHHLFWTYFQRLNIIFITFSEIEGCLESSDHNLVASILEDKAPIQQDILDFPKELVTSNQGKLNWLKLPTVHKMPEMKVYK